MFPEPADRNFGANGSQRIGSWEAEKNQTTESIEASINQGGTYIPMI
jgi:hypothetical protein